MKKPNLVLYYRPTCPFCQKVFRAIEGKDIELDVKNISEDVEAKNALEKIGGKVQVPCLFIDGKPLYESDDIIDYLLNQ